MKKIAIFTLLAMYACQKQDFPERFNEEILQPHSIAQEKAAVEKFARMFYNSFPKSKKSTRNTTSATSLEKINAIEEDELWVANYPDGGYVVMAYSNKTFPIVRFDTCGQFHYDRLSSEGKYQFKQALANSARRAVQTRTDSGEASLWDYLLLENNSDSDTTHVVEFSFFADKLLPDSTALSNMEDHVPTLHSPSGIGIGRGEIGSIPFRTYAKNYPTTIPLLGLKGLNRKWGIEMPYNYDLPRYIATTGFLDRPWLEQLTVCLALIIDDHDYFSWRIHPDVQTQNASTKLTRFLRQLSDEMGVEIKQLAGSFLGWSHVTTTIPDLMPEYGFEKAYPVRYHSDEASFEILKNHLLSYDPLILFSKRSEPDHVSGGFIFDGVSEMRVRVKTTSYVIGIPISTWYKSYYMDYFHVVSPIDHTDDGWWLYDACSTGNDYVYLMYPKF